MMKKILGIVVLSLLLSSNVKADRAVVVATYGVCDYFIADGPRGLYVLEWFGGKIPMEGDIFFGDVGSYGMKRIEYQNGGSGQVWVEDFLETPSAAIDEINDHC
tara:strand:- start:135 stop:446 length:312 start_codon:yes stop_codon:yes gene_type:complete